MAKVLMKGNEAVGKAAIEAGCRYFFGYPITPQSEVPEYLSVDLPKVGGTFVQAESEVAAINMVYGAAAAGARVLTSSSSPGIALKQEGIGYISNAGLPAVIINMMRGGPGLGTIQPGQADYNMTVKGGANGDYHNVVLAPASVQEAVEKYMRKHDDIHKFYEKVTFQLNDTHPTVAIAELMRVLMDDYYLTWEEAWEITTKTCAYTNHTIMAEALEKWPIELFSRLLPRIYQIVEEINRRFVLDIQQKYSNVPGVDVQEKIRKMAIIYDGQVKMANMAIVSGYSVNGVARLHTEILEKQELKDFYEMFPERFNNKTNGITQRRFLLHANPLLADWVTAHVGDDWITDLPQISRLKVYADDKKAQQEFMNIKYQNKVRLAKYIQEHNGIEVNPHSIFDVQVKRLHEYKRQLMNILHVMYLYNEIKAHPEMDFYPRTFIFGAKASAGLSLIHI